MTTPKDKDDKFADLDWVTFNKNLEVMYRQETMREKFMRKFGENPFVPIGILATTCALSYGLWSFRQGRAQMSQYMMRTRIIAQTFTIVAIVAGIAITASKSAKD